VEGDVDASAWTDKEGSPRASLELTATNIRFLGGRGEGGEGGAAGGAQGDSFPANEDDIPF
jgi:single-strand DNA-binding protein